MSITELQMRNVDTAKHISVKTNFYFIKIADNVHNSNLRERNTIGIHFTYILRWINLNLFFQIISKSFAYFSKPPFSVVMQNECVANIDALEVS